MRRVVDDIAYKLCIDILISYVVVELTRPLIRGFM